MDDYGHLLNQEVAAELRAEKARKKRSVAYLVEHTTISKSAIENYLKGARDIPTPSLGQLCRALDVSVTTLMKRAEDAVGEKMGP